jgi:hypothetical protein
VKLTEVRPGVYDARLTTHELSVLLAGARMSLSLMEAEPGGATERARSALAAVLANVDAELAKAKPGAPDSGGAWG